MNHKFTNSNLAMKDRKTLATFYSSKIHKSGIDGELNFRKDGYTATLGTPLFNLSQVSTENHGKYSATAISADPTKVSQDYLPRPVHFTDEESGICGILLDAHAELHHGPSLFSPLGQKLSGNTWVTSHAPITEPLEPRTLRVFITCPKHEPVSESTENGLMLDHNGARTEITVRSIPANNTLLGFEFEARDCRPMEWWLSQVARPLSSLLSIAFMQITSISSISMEIGSEVVEYKESGFDESKVKSSRLVPPGDITPILVKSWLSVAQELGQIHYYVSSEHVNLQVDALLYSSALEGIHRRAVEENSKIQLTRSQERKLRNSIKFTISQFFEKIPSADVQEMTRRAAPYASMIQSPDYTNRLRYFTDRFSETYPFLFGPDIELWINDVKSIRNKESHLFALGKNDEKVHPELEYVKYITYNYSLRILLTIILLDLAGISGSQLRPQIESSDYIRFQLANLDLEEYWKEYSAIEQFEIWKAKSTE